MNLNIPLPPPPLLSPPLTPSFTSESANHHSLPRPLHRTAPPPSASLLQLPPLPGIQHGSRNNTINLFSPWFSIPPRPHHHLASPAALDPGSGNAPIPKREPPTSCLFTLMKKIMKRKQRNGKSERNGMRGKEARTRRAIKTQMRRQEDFTSVRNVQPD